MTRTTCRGCESANLELVIDLGNQPPSNKLLTSFNQPVKAYPLCMVVCTVCWLMQLDTDVPHNELFDGDYPFRSASNKGMMHGGNYAGPMAKRFGLHSGSYVVEVGGNDGTLLKNFDFCQTLNIEPSSNVAQTAMADGIPTIVARIQDLSLDPDGSADLLIANNVMAHDPDLNGFVAGIARNLAPAGTAVIEFPWAVSMLEHGEFDTIYHEHYSYFSLTALRPLFKHHGLCIYDVDTLPIHGGTLRIYATRVLVSSSSRIHSVLAEEACLRDKRTYEIFRERAFNCAGALRRFIDDTGPLYGMGAAAKATVFTNFAGLTYKDIPATGDNTPAKWDKYIPGAKIPIMREERVLAEEPERLLLFPWNWREPYAAKLRSLGYKGEFVVAIPELEIFE